MELARIKVRCCLLVCGFEHAEFSDSKWIWLDGGGDILVFYFLKSFMQSDEYLSDWWIERTPTIDELWKR